MALLVAAAGCRAERIEPLADGITIALPALPHTSLVQVAVAKGYFAREGLAVTLQPYASGKQALNAVTTGKADLATAAETPLVFAALHGEPIAVLATLASSTRATAVVARKESGITTARDLAGKRVGLVHGTSPEFFLDTLLVRNEVDRGAVRIVEMKLEDMPAALQRGEVDAVATWIPSLKSLQDSLGDKVITLYAEDVYWETFNIASRRGFAEQRPEAAKRLLRALLRAEALFRDDPQAAHRALLAASKEDPAETLGLFEFHVRLDESLLVLMEEEARWAIRAGLVPKQQMPNFLESIAAEPLLAVNPDAVGLIR
jgi:NitT/TauT family transport system substrate-binding protein